MGDIMALTLKAISRRAMSLGGAGVQDGGIPRPLSAPKAKRRPCNNMAFGTMLHAATVYYDTSPSELTFTRLRLYG